MACMQRPQECSVQAAMTEVVAQMLSDPRMERPVSVTDSSSYDRVDWPTVALKGPGHSYPRAVRALARHPTTSRSSRRRDAVVLVYDRTGDHLLGNNVRIPGNPDWSY